MGYGLRSSSNHQCATSPCFLSDPPSLPPNCPYSSGLVGVSRTCTARSGVCSPRNGGGGQKQHGSDTADEGTGPGLARHARAAIGPVALRHATIYGIIIHIILGLEDFTSRPPQAFLFRESGTHVQKSDNHPIPPLPHLSNLMPVRTGTPPGLLNCHCEKERDEHLNSVGNPGGPMMCPLGDAERPVNLHDLRTPNDCPDPFVDNCMGTPLR